MNWLALIGFILLIMLGLVAFRSCSPQNYMDTIGPYAEYVLPDQGKSLEDVLTIKIQETTTVTEVNP